MTDSQGAIVELQRRFMHVLNSGPAAFPHGLFLGDGDRALLGLKAHANTISHARLVALEDTFPHVRSMIGDAVFNALSRAYLDSPTAQGARIMEIGRGFPAFMAAQHESLAVDAAVLDCAHVEWAWLQSYHAAEAEPLTMQAIAGLTEPELLALAIAPHPSVRLVDLQIAPASQLPLAYPEGIAPGDVAAIILLRPDSHVAMIGLDGERRAVAVAAQQSSTMRNLFERAFEKIEEAKALPHILALIDAGMLARTAA